METQPHPKRHLPTSPYIRMTVLVNPKRQFGASASDMARFSNVPQAEARLLKALVEGLCLADYAKSAGVSLNTVKTHFASSSPRRG